VAELTPQERLQPALLDRLIDDEPQNQAVEPPERRVMNRTRIRQAVLRDLAWLFNATNLGRQDSFAAAPHAERSVVNYGLPPLAGETASSLDVVELERLIRQAIEAFEPRILADSLEVEPVMLESELDHRNVVSINIRGALWAQPVPLEMLLRTSVDLETGEVEISDLSRGS
jgi:type VI secretion system protein ImpF